MTEQEKRLHRCCFAGHRPEGILLSETTAKDWLRYQIQQAIAANYTTFITGMGMGVDIWAAQIVIELRAANPSIHLIAVEPYPSFAAKWSEEWRSAYQEVITKADFVKRISQRYPCQSGTFHSRGFGIDAPHTAEHPLAWHRGAICQCDLAGRVEAHGPTVCTPLRRSGYRRESWQTARRASPLHR